MSAVLQTSARTVRARTCDSLRDELIALDGRQQHLAALRLRQVNAERMRSAGCYGSKSLGANVAHWMRV